MTRFGFVITTYAAVLFVALTSVFHPAPNLLWNASASVPIGLYVVRHALPLHVGELVVITPPQPLAQFFAARHYLPLGVPLVKHVLALPGQTVCRSGRAITVDGAVMGEALEHDRFGRALPDWQGCRALAPDEVFVMNTVPPDSLDAGISGHCHSTPSSAGPIQSGRARRTDHVSTVLSIGGHRVVPGLRPFLLPGHRCASSSLFRLTSCALPSPLVCRAHAGAVRHVRHRQRAARRRRAIRRDVEE